MSNTKITLQPGDSVTVEAAVGPVPPIPPIPPQPPAGSVFIGTLQPDGVRHVATGVTPSTSFIYAQFTIPNAPGKVMAISVYEYGGPAIWRKVNLAKTVGDFTALPNGFGQGTGVTLTMAIATNVFGSMTVQPGEVWYCMIRDQTLSGSNSCAVGQVCDPAIALYPPS